jgi:hypothetical protein
MRIPFCSVARAAAGIASAHADRRYKPHNASPVGRTSATLAFTAGIFFLPGRSA